MVGLESSSILWKGKNTAKQCMDRSSGRHSKRERWTGRIKEDI